MSGVISRVAALARRPRPMALPDSAGILSALGKINFLFDRSSTPYISREDLAGHCGVKLSTASGKSKQIRDMLKMDYWDSRFSTERMHDRNPYEKFYSLLIRFR